MQLFGRGRKRQHEPRSRGLAGDARAIRPTLAEVHAEQQLASGAGAALDLRAIVRDLLEAEVAAPTADIAELARRDTDPDEFYDRELKPAWDGLNESQRAARVEGFIDLARMLEDAGEVPGLDPVSIKTKTLLLAWAFDEEHGYLPQLAHSRPG